MVEGGRKHGSFDRRYPELAAPPTPTWVDETEDGLEWTEFLARFFPNARRHDVDALAAYGAYRGRPRSSAGTLPVSPVPA